MAGPAERSRRVINRVKSRSVKDLDFGFDLCVLLANDNKSHTILF
jgi:hypothetical protein